MLRDPKAIIYSDSDGVICDFYLQAERVLGHKWKHEGGKVSEQDQGLILNQHERFWETIPPMSDWKLYWGHIEKYGPHILTAVPGWDHNFDEVERGKREWYRRHIPTLLQSRIHVVQRRNKKLFAVHGNTRNILIDDHPNNIKEFEAAGGIAIHHVSAKVTIIRLKELGYY